MRRIYLDYAATTPTHPRVVEAMVPFFSENFGNPSSVHFFGQQAKKAITKAREEIAALIHCTPEEIIFTGGGTEADNFALRGIAWANREKGNHIITTSIEHHAVLETCRWLEKHGFRVTYLPVDEMGLVDPKTVEEAITNETILISVMHANNEIGTIQPIKEIGEVAVKSGIPFHTDAVQTVGHLEINLKELKVDLLSSSAHKLYGPKGVGFLYIRKGTKIQAFLRGGEQERRLRASTENVPGIVGFGEAAKIARQEREKEEIRLKKLREKLITGISEKIEESKLNGHPTQRLPNNVNFSIKYVEGESMLLNLDLEGIAASTGSACSSSTLEPSHVLLALGLSHEMAHSSLRLTLGRGTTEEDIEYVLEVLPKIVTRLREMSPLWKRK
jgi:cysteine desulfurase